MIQGYGPLEPDRIVSAGQVAFRTSSDPVGAPIFFRDVPLMPAHLAGAAQKIVHAIRGEAIAADDLEKDGFPGRELITVFSDADLRPVGQSVQH